MRVAVQTLGSRGDVQPYLALALGLMERGHQVQIAAPEQFETLIRRRGVGFSPLPGTFLSLLDTPEGKAAIAGSRGFGAGLKLLRHVRPLMRDLLDAEWHALEAFAPNIILHHPKSLASPHAAEKLNCPFILASPLPGFTPTADYPSPMLPFASLGPLNRPSHQLAMRGAELLFGRTVADWRRATLGLDGRRRSLRRSAGTLYAYSGHVVPPSSYWPPDVLVSGYWFLDTPDWQPDDALRAFLAKGEPPVYVGFGSMPELDPARTTAIIVEALRLSGKRGLLMTGGGVLAAGALPAHVHVLAEAPHDGVLPAVSAAIHHGGAGTTGAVLRAGKPMAITPFFGDQPFWARRVAALGLGPPPLDRATLTAPHLADAIRAMDDPVMRDRAAAIGTAIRREDGIAAAACFMEERAGRAVA